MIESTKRVKVFRLTEIAKRLFISLIIFEICSGVAAGIENDANRSATPANGEIEQKTEDV